ncbi:MAG: hypothetical protein CMO66_06745, partial [Verrucomicrobiales bacterium]|nr:hypothetical protein [Verrucomicrobiales bacterium]
MTYIQFVGDFHVEPMACQTWAPHYYPLMHRQLAWVCLFPVLSFALEGPPSVKQSLKLFQIEKGAKIEIAAAEPQL